MERAEHPTVIKGDWKRCMFLIALAGSPALAMHYWFFPWLREFSVRAHCVQVAGINGSVVLFATLFIGLTFVVFAFTIWLAFYSRKILRAGQMPPPGTWVCRDTVPEMGRKVKARAYFGLVTPLFGCACLCWGVVMFFEFKRDLIDPSLEKLRRSCVIEDDNSLQWIRGAGASLASELSHSGAVKHGL
jgi:hypothetical protein